MGIKELVEQVRSELTDEQMSKVGSVLKSIENEGLDLNNSLASANSESKSRKIEIRELKSKVEDHEVTAKSWETEKAELEEKINDPANTEKITALETFKIGVLQKQRAKFISSFDAISKHANWANAKSLYNIPTETEKKTIDEKEVDVLKWETIDEGKMEQNINRLDEHNIVNLFGESSKLTPGHRKGIEQKIEHEVPKTIQQASDNIEAWRQQRGA